MMLTATRGPNIAQILAPTHYTVRVAGFRRTATCSRPPFRARGGKLRKLKSALHAFNVLKRSSERYGVAYSKLAGRFIRLYRRRRFSPYEIDFYDLLDPRISDQALNNYMSRDESIAFDAKHVLNSYLCATSDKAVFYSLCMAAGLPIPKLLAVFDSPSGWTPDGRTLSSQSDWCRFMQSLPVDFIVKPALGLLGKGVTAFTRKGNTFEDHDGRRRNAEELYTFLLSEKEQNLFAAGFSHHSLRLQGESHKSILQERLYAHPDIAQLTGSAAVSTCRLFTHFDRSGKFQLLAAAMRVINGNNIVDNFERGTRGNLWCSVDAESGRITEACVRADSGASLERVERHPATGRDIVGFGIPRWSETVHLARHLANVFRPQSLIHWDIGITSVGPVVIEGNVGGQVLPTPLTRPVATVMAER